MSKQVYPSFCIYKHKSRLCIYIYHVTLFFTDYCDRATCCSDIPSDSYRGGFHGDIFIRPAGFHPSTGECHTESLLGLISLVRYTLRFVKCIYEIHNSIYIYVNPTYAISFIKCVRLCIYIALYTYVYIRGTTLLPKARTCCRKYKSLNMLNVYYFRTHVTKVCVADTVCWIYA